MSELPPALLDIAVRRVGQAYFVCPSSWEQLRHEEGGAGRPVPYWARPWPSGVGLAGALYDDPPPAGTTVLELGCGLALPSVMAARAGADVLATDGATDAVAFAAHVLALNDVLGEVAVVDWSTHGDALVARGPFDLVLAADVLYTRANAEAAKRCFRAWLRRVDGSSSPTRIAPEPSTSCRISSTPPSPARTSRSTPSGLTEGPLGNH